MGAALASSQGSYLREEQLWEFPQGSWTLLPVLTDERHGGQVWTPTFIPRNFECYLILAIKVNVTQHRGAGRYVREKSRGWELNPGLRAY